MQPEDKFHSLPAGVRLALDQLKQCRTVDDKDDDKRRNCAKSASLQLAVELMDMVRPQLVAAAVEKSTAQSRSGQKSQQMQKVENNE